MNATISAVARRALREESRRRLEDLVRPAQLCVLLLELFHPGPLIGRQPWTLPGIGFGSADPLAERLVVDRQLP
jgi:hypothetical protein